MPDISWLIGAGGLTALIGALTLFIRTLQGRKLVNADAAARLTKIGGDLLDDVRKDATAQITRARTEASEQVAQVRADAHAAIDAALVQATAARQDADSARRDADSARREANDARREVEELNRLLRRFMVELFRNTTDPALTLERLRALVGNGDTPQTNGRY